MTYSDFLEEEIETTIDEWVREGFTYAEAYKLTMRQIQRNEP